MSKPRQVKCKPAKPGRKPPRAWCKPKFTTYSGQAAIVDGSDGRTYILAVAAGYSFIHIRASDFMDARRESIGRQASVFDRDSEIAPHDAEIHAELLALILKGGALAETLTKG